MISIITPVYNGERFIEKCLQNVINQQCADLEHIIVDGCSTDRTVSIIQEYAARYSHIRWISERDQGQSDAMNKGIKIAQGEILGILNVDDYYEPNVFNRILDIFQGLPNPSFVAGNCNVWDDEGRIVCVNQPSKLSLIEFVVLDINNNPRNSLPCNPSAYFYHRSLHDIVGGYKVEEHYAMDLDFILRAVQKSRNYYFDEIWGNFQLIQGTKTLEDMTRGDMNLRVERILRQYQADVFGFDLIILYINFLKNITRRLYISLRQYGKRITHQF
jgi:glycosyltransferase involved in cell wall biosynthesis